MWITHELLPKIWGFWNKFRWSRLLEGPHEVFWEIFPFSWTEQHVHSFFPNPSTQVVHDHHHVLREKPLPNCTSCGRYWLLNFAPPFGQRMKPPSKTSNANLTTNPTCLEYEVFICYFGPHGSEDHPTPVHTFHPCGLPPSGSQTHRNVRWQPISGQMIILHRAQD